MDNLEIRDITGYKYLINNVFNIFSEIVVLFPHLNQDNAS